MNNKDTHLSKLLSWLLRHGAVKEGFSPSSEGYLQVSDILQHKSFRGYNTNDIERVVLNNAKQRFKLRLNPLSNVLEIKANQGHSIASIGVEDLRPILEPLYKTVIHGTYTRCWPSIRQNGLSCMQRQHIHLAKGAPGNTNIISGIRSNAQIYIYVNLKKALDEGLKFYESENGVILTPGNDKGYLEPKYFDKVVNANTGFPPCTRVQDLIIALSTFGAVTVDHKTRKQAVLTFSNEKEALAAIHSNRKVVMYGECIKISPYVPAAEKETKPPQKQRQSPKSKENSTIINPKCIDLSGAFYEQLEKLMAAVRLTQEEVNRIRTVYGDLESVLQALWPGCKAIPFGSLTTGLGVKTSDADCFIHIPQQFRHPSVSFVNKTKRLLQMHPAIFAKVLSIPRANTPIVKFLHIPTQTNCDVSFKTILGVQNSRLVAFLLHADPRLIPLSVVLKYWAKVHDFSGTGKMTNYTLTMMIIFYLQQLPMAILPSIEWLQRDPANNFFVDCWNTGFMLRRELLPANFNTSGISELLGGFFEFYSKFNFEEMVICPYLGKPIRKDAFDNFDILPEAFQLYKTNVVKKLAIPIRNDTAICVQDPVEQSHNVASAISGKMASDIKAYFTFAANAYDKEKLNNCPNFLKTILLEKPKLTKAKSQDEFKLQLSPKLVHQIEDESWKTVVRDRVLVIYEKMLKIKLGKVEETINPETKKEKEKYLGVVTTAVWKRKRFSRLYDRMDLSFEDRHEKITLEVLNTEKEVLAVNFKLILTFAHNPRNMVIFMKYTAGDFEAFKHFCWFSVSVMNNWLEELLKPYMGVQIHVDIADTMADNVKSLNEVSLDDVNVKESPEQNKN